jgi:hypothetical protein
VLGMTNATRVIRIPSADDHPLLRAGSAPLIAAQPDSSWWAKRQRVRKPCNSTANTARIAREI